MTPRKGDRVRVTYEAEYVEQIPSFGSTRHILSADDSSSGRRSEYSAPPNATIEVFEDLRPGDVVLDRDGVWLYRTEKPQLVWRTFVGIESPDSYAARPFMLHIRDGQVIQP
jgi:hypothetical protein